MEKAEIGIGTQINSRHHKIPLFKNIEIIVFDLYGTLIKINQKSGQSYFRVIFKQTQSELDLSPSEFFETILKTSLDQLIKNWPESFERAINNNEQLLQQEIKSVTLFEETIEVLTTLSKNYPLFLISNLATSYKQGYFDSNIDLFFKRTIFSCDVGLIKPNKEIFRLIEKETGKSNDQILMIGDSISADIKGAKNLNWKTIHINRNMRDKVRNKQQFIQIKNLRQINQML